MEEVETKDTVTLSVDLIDKDKQDFINEVERIINENKSCFTNKKIEDIEKILKEYKQKHSSIDLNYVMKNPIVWY